MDVLKLATDWAKAEVFSTRFFIFFAICFLLASLGFWQLGKTELARSYVTPTLVAGILLLIIGSGLLYTNIQRVGQFEKEGKADASSLLKSELERSEATMKEYGVVFKVIPILICLAALAILLFPSPTWRAINITTIAMLTVILLVDGTAYGRMDAYQKDLLAIEGTT